MLKKEKKANYYLAIGMILSTGTYVLDKVNWIPHWLRLASLIVAIIFMVYGVFKTQFGSQN